MPHTLEDILDLDQLRELATRFADLTGLHSGIVDARGDLRILSGAPGICAQFGQQPIAGAACFLRDPATALQDLPETGYRLAQCTEGLCQAFHPLTIEGQLVAVLCAGQFLLEPPDRHKAKARAKSLGLDPDTYWKALSLAPVLSREQLDKFMAFFSGLSEMIGSMGLSRFRLQSRERELEDQRRHFQSLFQASGDPLLLLTPERIIMEMNPAAERQFGCRRGELLGQHATALHPSQERSDRFHDMVYPEVRQHGSWHGLWTFRKKSGEPFEGEVTVTTMRDAQDLSQGFVVTLRDVTLRRLEEAQRDQTLAEMRAIFENTLIGVGLTRDGLIQRINQRGAEIFGYAPEELEGHHPLEFQYGSLSDKRFVQEYDKAMASRGWFTAEHSFRHKSGHEIWVRLYAKALDRENISEGVIWALDDVTDRRRMEEELARAKEGAERASLSKSMFLANMSHEIRTPLSGVLAMLQLARQEPGKSRELVEYLDNALGAGNSLLTIINDVIDLSRVEAGRLDLVLEPLSLPELVREVASAFQPQCAHKGVPLEIEIDPELDQKLMGDPHRIRQVLFNLVSNAIKFTDQGEVRVEARVDSRTGSRLRARITVHDSGLGIPGEQLETIFDPFARGLEPQSQIREGSGLGLAIVRRLMELMGGEVKLDSVPGQGTTATVVLPLALGRPEAARKPVRPEVPEKDASSTCRVLVAEDNRVNQIAVRRFLERAGYEVTCVENGEQAVSAVEAEDFDCLLMDIQMPVLDGEEATRRIRALEQGRNLPIIALTAYAMKGDRERFLELGMNDYLAKPVNLDELLRTIGKWCGRQEESHEPQGQ